MLKVYDDAKKHRRVYFKLFETSSGGVDLSTVDRNGCKLKSLLYIDSLGIFLSKDIDKNIGIPLDKEGKLLIHKIGCFYETL